MNATARLVVGQFRRRGPWVAFGLYALWIDVRRRFFTFATLLGLVAATAVGRIGA